MPYPTVNGKLAIAMQLDLVNLHENFPDVHRRYFGYSFPDAALSPFPVAQDHLQRIRNHWRAIHEEPEDDVMPRAMPVNRIAAA